METAIILSLRYVIFAYIGKIIVLACLSVVFYYFAGLLVFRVKNLKKKSNYKKVITAVLIILTLIIYFI